MIGARAVQVMAGNERGRATHVTFVSNLKVACEMAQTHDLTILIESLNANDVPGYFLGTFA